MWDNDKLIKSHRVPTDRQARQVKPFQMGATENAGLENAGQENGGPNGNGDSRSADPENHIYTVSKKPDP